jgi:hypothetical protein
MQDVAVYAMVTGHSLKLIIILYTFRQAIPIHLTKKCGFARQGEGQDGQLNRKTPAV